MLESDKITNSSFTENDKNEIKSLVNDLRKMVVNDNESSQSIEEAFKKLQNRVEGK